MVIYFSGTGNSRFVATFLARYLQDEVMDAGMFLKEGKKAEFVSQKPYVFVAPIYSWQMPEVFEEFLKQGSFTGNRAAYFVFTCGGDMGAAGEYAKAICEEKDLFYQGSVEVVMPDNYILMFTAPEEEEARTIIKNALPGLKKAGEYIRQMKSFPEKNCSLIDKIKSGVVNRGFRKYFIKAKGFYATEKCISCGKCATDCALNNITVADGKPKWGEHCTQCMACICGCPREAIEYGNKTKGKVRYQCPEDVEPVGKSVNEKAENLRDKGNHVEKQTVYEYLTRIPKGKVVTYGQIGEYLGNKNLARTVGNILHENPDGEAYPCYKVVDARGHLSEHYAFGGMESQRRKLEADGIVVEVNKVNLSRYQWQSGETI